MLLNVCLSTYWLCYKIYHSFVLIDLVNYNFALQSDKSCRYSNGIRNVICNAQAKFVVSGNTIVTNFIFTQRIVSIFLNFVVLKIR